MENARRVAANALVRVERDGSYSNLVLGELLKSAGLAGEDKAFATALFYGVLDRRITLDYILKQHIKTPLKKVAPFTLACMRCAVYQIMYMDRIPNSAAVNEAVKLIKASRENRCAGFANAVLRNTLRCGTDLPSGRGVTELSVKYSCPETIVRGFIADYGDKNAEGILSAFLEPPPVTLRVNTIKTSADLLAERLLGEGAEAVQADTPGALHLKKGVELSALPSFKEGLFHIQDEASQRAIAILNPQSGERMLDMCAAPGGKSFTAAELMCNKGEIVACDIHPARVGLIKDGAERLGLDIVKPATANATAYNPTLGQFDCILCDAPCSGFGVLRRKPEIKYNRCELDGELEKIQLAILENAVKYLKPGGRILYSTCTLRASENEKLVNSFIMRYNMLHKVYEHTFMPHIDRTDGFYCALLQSKQPTAD